MNDQRNENASLFIGGLKPAVKRQDIVAHFTKYGEVKNVNMGKLPSGMNNRGFAFVKFSNVQDNELALADKQYIMGREVECRLSYGKKYNQVDMEINSKRKLYVCDLSAEDKNEDLQSYFSVFGKIDQAYIIYYPNTQVSKCFGYVEFKHEKSAAKALNAKHNTWKVSNFKSYKDLKIPKNEFSDSKTVKKSENTLSTSDSENSGSENNFSLKISAKKKGAIYSKIVEEQQKNYSIGTCQTDMQQSPNFNQEQYNYYPNSCEAGYYQDQQQIDYYNQECNQYYGYQQIDPNYSYGYEQYPNQYYNSQQVNYEYNNQNNYYNCDYYQQNDQMITYDNQSYKYLNDNVNFNYDMIQNAGNFNQIQESSMFHC